MFGRKKQSRTAKARQLIAKINPRSPISEQYRTIRTNLQFASIDKELSSMVITSSQPGEGKSMTAANLAVVYAQQGKKVLLIDGDLRKPTVHYTFRLDNLVGLSTVLVNEMNLEDSFQETDIPNLSVISSGPNPPNPSELLGSKRMEKMVKEAEANFDIVIIDSPPILAVTDAQILANIVDGSLLVIRSAQTVYDNVEQAIEALNRSTSKMLGTILNDVEQKKSNTYYYYGS